MSKPETTFISSVHRHLPVDLYRMKNHNMYNAGIADVWYDGSEADLWVEYKFLVLPKRDDAVIDLTAGKNPPLSVLQQAWLRDRYHNGRSVHVVVGCKEGGVWLSELEWEQPYTAKQYRNLMLTRQEVAKEILHLVGPP